MSIRRASSWTRLVAGPFLAVAIALVSLAVACSSSKNDPNGGGGGAGGAPAGGGHNGAVAGAGGSGSGVAGASAGMAGGPAVMGTAGSSVGGGPAVGSGGGGAAPIGGAPGGAGRAGGTAGGGGGGTAAGTGGAGGAASTCGGLGQACCTTGGPACGADLACLGGGSCSCVKTLYQHHLLRQDGRLLYEINDNARTQTPIVDAASGLALTGITDVHEGDAHACALAGASKTVWCWRAVANGNSYGQLGSGAADSSGPVYRASQVFIAAAQPLTDVSSLAQASAGAQGVYTTCAVTTAGALYCWGDMTWVASGGTRTSSAYAVPITSNGSTPLAGVAAVAVAPTFACAIVRGATEKEVWCWGDNTYEQLGTADTKDRPYPTKVVGVSAPVKLALTLGSSCVLDESGGVRCWGYNASGEAGNGSTTSPVHAPAVVTLMGGASPLSGVTDLVAGSLNGGGGYASFCALTATKTILCWGYSFHEYPSTYNVTNVSAIGASDNMTGVRFVTSDGIYHVGATPRTPNCGLLQ